MLESVMRILCRMSNQAQEMCWFGFGIPSAPWTLSDAAAVRLAKLNAEQLDDIGLTKAEARREAVVPFWR